MPDPNENQSSPDSPREDDASRSRSDDRVVTLDPEHVIVHVEWLTALIRAAHARGSQNVESDGPTVRPPSPPKTKVIGHKAVMGAPPEDDESPPPIEAQAFFALLDMGIKLPDVEYEPVDEAWYRIDEDSEPHHIPTRTDILAMCGAASIHLAPLGKQLRSTSNGDYWWCDNGDLDESTEWQAAPIEALAAAVRRAKEEA